MAHRMANARLPSSPFRLVHHSNLEAYTFLVASIKVSNGCEYSCIRCSKQRHTSLLKYAPSEEKEQLPPKCTF
jgi:hypothetical protein